MPSYKAVFAMTLLGLVTVWEMLYSPNLTHGIKLSRCACLPLVTGPKCVGDEWPLRASEAPIGSHGVFDLPFRPAFPALSEAFVGCILRRAHSPKTPWGAGSIFCSESARDLCSPLNK